MLKIRLRFSAFRWGATLGESMEPAARTGPMDTTNGDWPKIWWVMAGTSHGKYGFRPCLHGFPSSNKMRDLHLWLDFGAQQRDQFSASHNIMSGAWRGPCDIGCKSKILKPDSSFFTLHFCFGLGFEIWINLRVCSKTHGLSSFSSYTTCRTPNIHPKNGATSGLWIPNYDPVIVFRWLQSNRSWFWSLDPKQTPLQNDQTCLISMAKAWQFRIVASFWTYDMVPVIHWLNSS